MFPAAAYVPGRAGAVRPEPDESMPRDGLLAHGAALFDRGYYWEAHEAWERLWQTHRGGTPERARLQGLIALAAAGVKVRQGQQAGVRRHARRAMDFFRRSGDTALAAYAARIDAAPPAQPASDDGPEVVFAAPLPRL